MRRLALALLLLVACGEGINYAPQQDTQEVIEWQYIANSEGAGANLSGVYVGQVTINGIECIVVAGGGISCDWGER